MLAYTLQRTLTQQARIERDNAEVDAGGARRAPAWRPHLTVACRLWWDRSGSRSPSREYVAPQRTVPLQVGGLILPAGTDVTEQDRIAAILDRHGNIIFAGIFEILAVTEPDGQFTELAVQRAKLGA